jgi:hypothetical protein
MPEFDTPEPISVVIDLVVGEVRIVASDRIDTVVEVRPSDGANRADVAAAEQTRVEHDGDALLVKTGRRWRSYSPFGFGGSVDLQVGLPTGSRVTGETSMGAFRCTGSLGDCQLKTSIGDIHLDRAAAVKLNTSVGDISVERATGDAELSTGSGAVSIGEIDGAALIKNSNGDTRIGEITGELRVKAANGDIAIEDAHASLEAKTANGDIHVGTARRGSVVAETGFGGVEIAIPDGTAAWLDLNTKFGHVHNTLDATERPERDVDSVAVRARTSYGDITIRRSYAPAHADSGATRS